MKLREPGRQIRAPRDPKHAGPNTLTRATFLLAAAVPWYAVFSGVYGLYFYILVAVTAAGNLLGLAARETASSILFAVTLVAAIPLALLLLVVLPVGAVWAAFRRPPRGLFGKAVRGGCITSMGFCVVYFLIIISVKAYSVTQGNTLALLQDPWPALHALILLGGLVVTAKAWHWLRKDGELGQPDIPPK